MGKRHGTGKWIQPDGAEYEGEYKFDKMWGTGTWRSKDGDVVSCSPVTMRVTIAGEF